MENNQTNTYMEETNSELVHTYNRFPVVLDHGEGVYLYDTEGKKYLDFAAGIAVCGLGYSNEEYKTALKNQIDLLTHTSNLYYNTTCGKAAKALLKACEMDKVFFTNSGTEAIEGALKAARKYAYKKGTGRYEFIAMEDSFHGRSMGALSVTGTEHYRTPFEPLIPGVKFAKYNDLDSVKALVSDKTCAIILEALQGEGGITPATDEFMKGLRQICDEEGILLICDEIQCGMGRTGSMFAWQGYGVKLGYKGLHDGEFIKFDRHSTRNIINIGGTMLKSARFPEFKDPEVRKEAIEKMKEVGMEALVVIGGDGSYNGALKLTEMGINCIGIPGTIDNDIPDTDHTIGFDTALNTIVDALDKLRDTSSSHQRCTILEVMGRRCGDLAINAGIADGAEMVITSEIGFDENKVIEVLKASKASDKKHAIVVITEHITDVHELAKKVEAATGFETRANVLGHMQRGGRPSARDRVLASRMGVYAVELLEAGKGGLCVSEVNGQIKGLPITEVLGHKRETDFSIYEDAIKLR